MSARLRATDEASSRFVVPNERFEVEQYVRVHLGNNRTEIGVVSAIDEDRHQVTVTTRQGYDVTVRSSAVRRAFLLVLDLNGVLVARGRGTFIHRPHVAEFVKFVFNNFVVAVWTSGLERSSNPIIDSVLDGYQDRLLFTLYRESCVPCPTPDNPYGTIKNLQRIFDDYPKSFHSVNTIIIDDSPDKCSHPDIALCPIPFKDPVAQSSDDGLSKAMEVLHEVLALDSHTPLIQAAEERLSELHERAVHPAAAPQQLPQEPPLTAEASTVCELPQINLWKTRLCCEYTRGCCKRGDQCGYSHDPDNGKSPCSLKNKCRYGHASRWVDTEMKVVQTPKKKKQQQWQQQKQQQQQQQQQQPHQPPQRPQQQQQQQQQWQLKQKQQQQQWQPRQRGGGQEKDTFWTLEEERSAMNATKSHTGIPHLDREIEAAAAADASKEHGGTGGNVLSFFSTNPHTASGGNVGRGHHPVQPAQPLNVSDRLAHERARLGNEQPGTAGFPGLRQGNRATTNNNNNSSQPTVKVDYPVGGTSVSAPSSTVTDIHLTGSRGDGTALLRQLERMTRIN